MRFDNLTPSECELLLGKLGSDPVRERGVTGWAAKTPARRTATLPAIGGQARGGRAMKKKARTPSRTTSDKFFVPNSAALTTACSLAYRACGHDRARRDNVLIMFDNLLSAQEARTSVRTKKSEKVTSPPSAANHANNHANGTEFTRRVKRAKSSSSTVVRLGPPPGRFAFQSHPMNDVAKRGPSGVLLASTLTSAKSYLNAEKAANTIRSYRAGWKVFIAWCDGVGVTPMPASLDALAGFFAHQADAGMAWATIECRKGAIAYAHKLAGQTCPLNDDKIVALLTGIKRSIGTAKKQKAPVTAVLVHEMLNKIPRTLAGLRDRALLLIGLASAMRRSELVGIDVEHIERVEEGIVIHIGRSKTDQEGVGQRVAVPHGVVLKPVEAMDSWLTAASIKSGAVFRRVRAGEKVCGRLCDRTVLRIVQKYAALIGLKGEEFGAHSLRAGFVTSALEAGADLFKIMDTTRHRSVETLRDYDRRAKEFKDHAGSKFL
jgi:site-specific recombinase XerD